jgi:hypothetical protein
MPPNLARPLLEPTLPYGRVMEAIVEKDAVLRYAQEGRLTKHALASMLTPDARQRFLDACAGIEKRYTEQCSAANDPCLESGCSVEGEICLQPLLQAGTEYHRACAAEWQKLFAKHENRLHVR